MEKDDIITYEDGGCNYEANGFDCRDCPFADICENFTDFND